jgi:outer membrane protein assembly factor BamB
VRAGSALRLLLPALLAAAAIGGPDSHGGEWPTYRGNAGRGNYTAEELPAGISLRWVYRPGHPPRPAWPREPVMSFDRAHHTVADAERVYFGSSADCKVYALDAATGGEVWTFFTGAPVRFAPALWKDRLFAASDDGHLYCLEKKSGKLLWKKRPGPSGRMILGNGRMISKWPVRGGPAVVGNTVYFGAGIWPNDGIFICALEAATGKSVWVNSTSGSELLYQPHAPKPTRSGVSCQGYLAVAGKRVFVPTGRSVPAAFDRDTGKFLYCRIGPQELGFRTSGGTEVAAVDSLLFNADLLMDAKNGHMIKTYYPRGIYFRLGGVQTSLLAATPKHFYTGAVDRFLRAKPIVEKKYDRKSKDGSTTKRKLPGINRDWSFRLKVRGTRTSLIVAGKTVIVGGAGFVAAVSAGGKKLLWSHRIDGKALSLAVAGGRLLVSTDTGAVYCFAAGNGPARTIEKKLTSSPPRAGGAYAAAAQEIVRKTGVTEGYCLDLGCGEGQLALELARRTKLKIYGIEKDPVKVALARKRLDAAGLYGVRVTVHQGDPAASGYPNYFADVVVSGDSVRGAPVPEKEVLRCQRPYGGAACIGKLGAMKKTVRGPPTGAGVWTHQYADPANSTCSDDELVKAPLTVLWFDELPLGVPDRHGRPPAPLFAGGRLYVQGHSAVSAVDPYNGRVLWKFPIKNIGDNFHAHGKKGVQTTGSNMCTDGEGKTVFVRQGARCIRIDGASGRKLGELQMPIDGSLPSKTWGYIAWKKGVLFGSVSDEASRVPGGFRRRGVNLYVESKMLFAMDATTGKLKWKYRSKHSIRNNTIAIGKGNVYAVDRPATTWGAGKPHLPGRLLALDAATGRVKWEVPNSLGTLLAVSPKHDVLLVNYRKSLARTHRGWGKGRMAAYGASNGKPLWDVDAWDADATYGNRPVLVGRTIYSNPYAYDLLSGKRRQDYRFWRAYGCGTLAAGKHILTFRSAAIGYRGLGPEADTQHFGGVKPGCWINAIPAGGLVMVPDYSTKCTCRYQMRCSLALEPR